MKKLLFSLLLLLSSMSAAWAGTGDGSKENPYSGEWSVMALTYGGIQKGSYFAYDCKISSPYASLVVFDDLLDAQIFNVVKGSVAWNVGDDMIGDTPADAYAEYCYFNPDRKNQTFVVTSVEFIAVNEIRISGYYSGKYAWREADGFIRVANAAAFKSVIQADNAAKVRLSADIDISGIGKICDMFRGTIDGGHPGIDENTGQEMTLPYMLDGKGENNHFLFEEVSGATFKDVAFHNFKIKEEDESNIGVIARTAFSTTFDGVMMLGASVFCNHDWAGTLVGTASNCIFNKVKVMGSDVTVNGIGAGGLIGQSEYCQFSECLINGSTRVFADGRIFTKNVAYAGGICGSSEHDRINDCVNAGWVGGECDEVGGICGHSNWTYITDSFNYGTVLQCGDDNFVKLFEDEYKVKYCYQYDEHGWVWWTIGTAVYVAVAVAIWPFSVTLAVLIGVVGGMGGFMSGMFLTDLWAGHDEIGGLVGHAEHGAIERCGNGGYFCGVDKYSGGIVGWAKNMTINNCYSEHDPGKIKADYDKSHDPLLDEDGNLILDEYGNPVYDDESALDLSMNLASLGSIVGYCEKCKITNNVAATYFNCLPDIDYVKDLDPESGNNYYWFDGHQGIRSEEDCSPYEERLDVSDFGRGLVAYRLNYSRENLAAGIKPWRQDLGGGSFPHLETTYPEVTLEDMKKLFYYETPNVLGASQPSHLQLVAYEVNGAEHAINRMFCLDDDINMEGVDWTPIGTKDSPFCGIFDGRGHTISGLKATVGEGSNDGVGFFGVVGPGAIIQNVTIKDSEFTNEGETGAAGLVGQVYDRGKPWGNILISNCGSSADVSGVKHAGGILGWTNTYDSNVGVKIQVYNCYSTGTVTAGHGNSALLCGYTKNNGVVSNCWSSGQLRNGEDKSIWPYSIENDPNNRKAECLVGYDKSFNIQNCYIVDPEYKVDQYENYKKQYPLQAGVKTLSAAEAAMGQLAYVMNKNCGNTIWEQNLGADEVPDFGTDGIYHVRTISESSKGYGTVCVPFAMESNDEISYYRFVESKDERGAKVLYFAYTTYVMAGEPVLFRTSKTGELAFRSVGDMWEYMPSFSNDVNHTAWRVNGTYEQKVFDGEDAEDVYYVSNGEIRNAKKTTIAPFRAYIVGDNINDLTSSGAKAARVRLVIDGVEDETLALELVAGDLMPEQSGKAYTLFGTEAGSDYRGLMIRGGKKVMVSE